MFDFKSLTNQWRAVGRERETLAKEIERLKQRREFLGSAPLPLEDEFRRIDEWVDIQAAAFAKRFRDRTQSKERRPRESYPYHAFLFMSSPNVQAIQEMACGLDPDQAKAGLRALAAKHWTWHAPEAIGPPLSEREREEKKIDAELAKLERQLSELDDQIQQAASEVPAGRQKVRGKTPRANIGMLTTTGDASAFTNPAEIDGPSEAQDQAPAYVKEAAADD